MKHLKCISPTRIAWSQVVEVTPKMQLQVFEATSKSERLQKQSDGITINGIDM